MSASDPKEDGIDRDSVCRCRGECPMNGECKAENIIYCADVTQINNDNTRKIYKYFGLTANKFIVRYRNHVHSFRNPANEKATELSKLIWKLKRESLEYSIKWSMVRRAKPYHAGSKFCNLCTSEAIQIAYFAGEETLINAKDEVINNCKHKVKWKLEKF